MASFCPLMSMTAALIEIANVQCGIARRNLRGGVGQMELHAVDGRILLRVICGLFLFPHFYHKLIHFNAAALRSDYFKGGWRPPVLFMGLNMAIESICGVLLVIGYEVKWAALVTAALMFAAAGTVPKFNPKGFAWLWAAGGIEYCVFWGLTAVGVAWLYW